MNIRWVALLTALVGLTFMGGISKGMSVSRDPTALASPGFPSATANLINLSAEQIYMPLIQQLALPIPPTPTPGPDSPPHLFRGPRQAGSGIDGTVDDVAAADVNGDGALDLISVYMASPEIAVCYNDGTGSFSAPWYVNEYAGTADLLPSLATGDIDQDGDIDLITATWNGLFGVPGDENSVAINLNRGDGTFDPVTLVTVSYPTTQVVTADFNLDGNPDIAVTYKDTDALTVLLNPGGGQYNDYQDYATGEDLWSLTVADLNADRYPDLIPVALSGEIEILLNRGDGTFWVKQLALVPGVQDIAAGDLDQDGDQDLAVLNSTDNSVSILLNRGKGTFDLGQAIPSTYWLNSVAVADFNQDENLDLVVANYDGVTVSAYFGDGQGGFSPGSEFIIGQAPHDILTADLNQDNFADVVAGADNTWAMALLNLGGGTFETVQTPYAISPDSQALVSSDLNGDSYADLIVYFSGGGRVASLFNDQHGKFSIHQQITSFSGLTFINPERPLVSADFDGDGDSDILFLSEYLTLSGEGAQVCSLRNDGTGELSPGDCVQFAGQYYTRYNALEASDLDLDGDVDAVLAIDGGLFGLFNNGQGQFEPPKTIYAQSSPVLESADLNGDGFTDLVMSDAEIFNQQLLVFLNLGDGGFAPPTPFDAVFRTKYTGLAAGDIDSDGDLDLALIYQTTAMVDKKGRIFINDGSGLFSPGSYLLFPGQSPNDVALADIDLDGDLDVLGSTNFNRIFTVNFNDGSGWFVDSEPLLVSVIAEPNALAASDIDLDLDIDVLAVGGDWLVDSDALTVRENICSELP